MRHAIGFGCVLAFVLGAAMAQGQTPAVTGSDELVATKGAYDATWVRPDADVAKYDALYVWAPAFEFREGGETSAGTTAKMLRGDSGPFAIREDDREKFRQLVTETFVAEIARSKAFRIAEHVGAGTLIVQAGFLDITSFVPPNVARYDNIHLAAVGEATLVFQLIDAETGIIQGGASERRLIQPEARMRGVNTAPANSATVWADVERWAREQGEGLRKALEKAKKKAE